MRQKQDIYALLPWLWCFVFSAKVGEGNDRLWPSDLSLDAESLHELRKSVCARPSTSNEKEESDQMEIKVRSKDPFLPKGFPEQPGVGGFMPTLLAFRSSSSALSDVSSACAEAAVEDEQSCSSDWEKYFGGVAMPFAVPALLGVIFIVLHTLCCFVACCRCCRRMMCCWERQAPRNATFLKVVLTILLWTPCSVAIFIFGASVHINNFAFHLQLNSHLCTALVLADEAIYGTDQMFFLGTSSILTRLKSIASALDVDSEMMNTIQKVLEQSSDFASKQEQLNRRMQHFTDVLNMSGPAFRAFEHRCVFCSLAVGDREQLSDGFPLEGLLPALTQEISESSSQAMYEIRQYTSSQLTGANLAALATKVKRSVGAFELLDAALKEALVNTWARRLPSLDTAESLRMIVFTAVGISAMASAVLGWVAFFCTRWRRKRKPNVVPSGKPHCGTWCCGFFYVTFALLLSGGLSIGTIFIGEGCIWMHNELFDYMAFPPIAPAFGLSAKAAEVLPYYNTRAREAIATTSIDIARACFSSNGTGDMLSQMQLTEKLAFQSDLSADFFLLQDIYAEFPVGPRSILYLDQLRDAALEYGGTFVLDPTPAYNGSLGVLELNPNVKEFLLGSTVDAEDKVAPGGQTNLQGLNSYAALIAGPGKYTFAHGTAGGGFVITHDRPTAEELASLPLNVRNALLYGRAKEQLLESTDSFRCDSIDAATGNVTNKSCGVRSFHDYVQAEVAHLKQDIDAVAAESRLVQHLFLEDLYNRIGPTLRLVRDLRMMTTCRFLWQRIESFDDALCEPLGSTVARTAVMNCFLAIVGTIGIILHYKVWRHLKDNKVVGLEMARFEKTYGLFQKRMQMLDDEKISKEAMQKAYQDQIDNMHNNALDPTAMNKAEQEARGQMDDGDDL